MKKSIIILALCALFVVPTFAQEAFYIYRNDGDFHGFFYDEVVEMRYSKIALDSVEHEQYVTYEVELADTTYRIPLAAIDSIGFQQPEIKLNPKVKLIQNEGLSPYLKDVNEFGQPEELVARFENLPSSLVPQVGDVLIGVGTDDCGEIYEKLGGSFSLVVQRIASNGNQISVYGRQVEEVGEVFEQFISVEQIGVDSVGKIRRRIAGCDENGLPRRITQVEGDHYAELINFNGNINKEWSIPDDSSKVVLNAALNFQVFMRAQYNISITRGVHVKLTNEFRTRIKPSLGVSLNGELRGNTDNLYSIYLTEVLFPVACPVFAVKPWPSYFLHLSGSIDAKLNFPQIYLGLGIEYIIDTDNFFPLAVHTYWAPDDGTMPDDELLSAEFSISGSIHQGIEFEGMINTASWFKKILQVAAGVHFYVGPKMTATVAFKHDFFNENNHGSLYWLLSAGQIDLSLISILMEITAKTKMGWYDPQEKTFFSGTKDFFEYQMRLLPVFDQTDVELTKKDVIVTVKPKSGINFKFNKYYLGIYDAAHGLYITDEDSPVEVTRSYRWIERITDADEDHTTTFPLKKFEVGRRYFAVPVIDDDSLNFIANGTEREFVVPLTADIESTTLHFNAMGNNVATQRFTTNCPQQGISFVDGDFYKTHAIDTIDSEEGIYELRCTAQPNRSLFMSPSIQTEEEDWAQREQIGYGRPQLSLRIDNPDVEYVKEIFIGFEQERNSLSNVSVDISVGSNFKLDDISTSDGASFSGPVTATRVNDDVIHITGTKTETDGYTKTVRTINMTLTRVDNPYSQIVRFMLAGTVTRTETYDNELHDKCTISFSTDSDMSIEDAYDGIFNIKGSQISINSGSYIYHTSSYGSEGDTYTYSFDGGTYFRGQITVKAPGEQ